MECPRSKYPLLEFKDFKCLQQKRLKDVYCPSYMLYIGALIFVLCHTSFYAYYLFYTLLHGIVINDLYYRLLNLPTTCIV